MFIYIVIFTCLFLFSLSHYNAGTLLDILDELTFDNRFFNSFNLIIILIIHLMNASVGTFIIFKIIEKL